MRQHPSQCPPPIHRSPPLAALACALLLGVSCTPPADQGLPSPPSPAPPIVAKAAGRPGPTPGQPTDAITQPAPSNCPEGMVGLSGGSFSLGVDPPRDLWESPRRQEHIEAFCMDRFEFPGVRGTLPRAHVSWREAHQLCEQAGKRLCADTEWGRACRGAERRRYSYGVLFQEKRCNTPFPDRGEPTSGTTPLAPSGAFPDCHNPEGVFDLDGNLSEWVADSFGPQYHGTPTYTAPDPSQLPAQRPQTLRGGTMWMGSYGQSCTSRHGHTELETYEDDGLRCCFTPPAQ